MTTEHLSIAAFRPKTLANVLAFPGRRHGCRRPAGV